MKTEMTGNESSSGRSRRSGILIAAALVAGVCSVAGWYFFGTDDDEVTEAWPPGVVVAPFEPPSTEGYAGSQACAECHEEIVELYRTHPMSRSITLVDPVAPEGLLPIKQRRVIGYQRFLEVDVEEGVMRHHEKMLDESGDLIYDQVVPMDYVVGSGSDAKSYIYHRGSQLFMSPLNWYSKKKVWDVAPGYAPDDARRFDRLVNDECLSCHTSRPAVVGRGLGQFQKPAFHEMSIGCESCHGPAKKHIEFHELADGKSGEDPIVNPAKLKPELRESVCNQCHHLTAARVLRHGRTHFDFRPGMNVDEIWTLMDAESDASGDGRVTAVSHVQQIRRSRCFVESAGQLGCISCHDPHRVPSESERAAFYRKRCLNCHDDSSCAAPREHRQAESDSCIVCHMPAGDSENVAHVSVTDHRVVRRRDEAAVEKADPAAKLALPENARKMPKWEQDRAFLVGNWGRLSRSGVQPGIDIISGLVELSKTGPEDRPILEALALSALQGQADDTAQKLFERLLKIPEAEISAVDNLLTIHYRAARFDRALDLTDRLLKVDPGSARILALRADILLNLDRRDEALAAAEQALKLHPTFVEVRVWLIRQLDRAGREADRKRHEEILQKMQTAILPSDSSSLPDTSLDRPSP
jgi:hypothetical protein